MNGLPQGQERRVDSDASVKTLDDLRQAEQRALLSSPSHPNHDLFKQVCVIPFRRDFLATFAALESTALERAESIDMLRALEHGYDVRMVRTAHRTSSVDTPEDLARVESLMRGDPLLAVYGVPAT